ncbi:hypothetical protein FAES_3478 [Fibrella aestuarina BUZ 2]|uniref:Uncharacterized protein n=1 Tax=Fibrella aestuarina BUZ 2 TaxID=1166018 RepID=I0KBI2_9BACT|nr:hypothetical protein [Fibrella aestuarina]CCH01485.1 hypothetical protein FAES_3478 [Fibrella aestuarina BUZ 2]
MPSLASVPNVPSKPNGHYWPELGTSLDMNYSLWTILNVALLLGVVLAWQYWFYRQPKTLPAFRFVGTVALLALAFFWISRSNRFPPADRVPTQLNGCYQRDSLSGFQHVNYLVKTPTLQLQNMTHLTYPRDSIFNRVVLEVRPFAHNLFPIFDWDRTVSYRQVSPTELAYTIDVALKWRLLFIPVYTEHRLFTRSFHLTPATCL